MAHSARLQTYGAGRCPSLVPGTPSQPRKAMLYSDATPAGPNPQQTMLMHGRGNRSGRHRGRSATTTMTTMGCKVTLPRAADVTGRSEYEPEGRTTKQKTQRKRTRKEPGAEFCPLPLAGRRPCNAGAIPGPAQALIEVVDGRADALAATSLPKLEQGLWFLLFPAALLCRASKYVCTCYEPRRPPTPLIACCVSTNRMYCTGIAPAALLLGSLGRGPPDNAAETPRRSTTQELATGGASTVPYWNQRLLLRGAQPAHSEPVEPGSWFHG